MTVAETITVHAEPIEVDTPFGKALCIAWYDYGFWTETQYKCITCRGGKVVFVPHQDIRYTNHYSARITSSKPPTAPAYMAKVLKNDPGVEAITSLDKFSDADHGERWAKHKPKPKPFDPSFGPDFDRSLTEEEILSRLEPRHLPEEDGA